MPEPLVSVVINNFNCEKYLSSAIESALSQTYPNVEVVVVDDGSTDQSHAVIQKFGSFIRAVFQPRQGETSACNTGFAASSGSILLFLEAEDMLFPASVRQIMEAWEEGAVKVQYRLEYIDDDGKSKGTAFPHYPKNYTPKALYRDFIATGQYPWPTASGNAYDRGFLAKILPLAPEAFPSAPESAINIIAPLFGKIISLPRPLACYRTPGSAQRASKNDVPTRFTRHINQKEREMEHLRAYAESMAVHLPLRNLLDFSQAYLESRLCARKLALTGCSTKPETLLRLCGLAFHNALISKETRVQRISSLLFYIALACSKGKFAAWLIALRYDRASCPQIMADMLKSIGLTSHRLST